MDYNDFQRLNNQLVDALNDLGMDTSDITDLLAVNNTELSQISQRLDLLGLQNAQRAKLEMHLLEVKMRWDALTFEEKRAYVERMDRLEAEKKAKKAAKKALKKAEEDKKRAESLARARDFANQQLLHRREQSRRLAPYLPLLEKKATRLSRFLGVIFYLNLLLGSVLWYFLVVSLFHVSIADGFGYWFALVFYSPALIVGLVLGYIKPASYLCRVFNRISTKWLKEYKVDYSGEYFFNYSRNLVRTPWVKVKNVNF